MTENEKPNFKTKATEQANQRRIALIAISVGLVAFFAADLNSSLTYSQSPWLYGTVICSALACISGLLAWTFSARMFYNMGNGKGRTGWTTAKNMFDVVLVVLLILGASSAFIHLKVEKAPSVTTPIQPAVR